MKFDELFAYFLENEGYKVLNNEKEKKETIEKLKNNLLDINSKEGRIFKDYIQLAKLEGNPNDTINEDQFKRDYENYKTIALRLLNEVSDDYDLKSYLILKDIDYKNFDNENNFKAYRYNRIYKIIVKEIKDENNAIELDLKTYNYLKRVKSFKYGIRYDSSIFNRVITKMNELLDEMDEIIEKRKLKEKYESYSKFSLGRMHLLTIKRLINFYTEHESVNDYSKEKYDLLIKYLEKDPNDDTLCLRNELGFLSYKINEMETYKKVYKLNDLNKRNDLIEYMLSNLNNIFDKEDKDKYIKEFIKENFYFLPILIYINYVDFKKEDITTYLKGSLKEAIKMSYFFFDYVLESFNNPYEAIVKDSMNNIEAYFNYYFEDYGMTYSLFKILEKNYINRKDIVIEDLENEYLKNYNSINHEEFLDILNNLYEIKLIKKIDESNFKFNKEEMNFLKKLDLIENKLFKDFNHEDDEIMDIAQKA